MKIDVSGELEVRTSRSGGKGGQHVNKVETQVEVRFTIGASRILHDEQKQILLDKLANKLTHDGTLIVRCNETRTQLSNKEIAIEKLHHVLEQCLIKRKARIATRASKAVKARRMDQKKRRGEIKKMRGKFTE